MKKLGTLTYGRPIGEIMADCMEDGMHLGMKMVATGATEEQVRELMREFVAPMRARTGEPRGEEAMSDTPRARLTEREVILDERECAQWLGIAFESFQDLRRRGEGPPFTRIGKGKIVYLKTRVIEWLDANQVFGEKKESQ